MAWEDLVDRFRSIGVADALDMTFVGVLIYFLLVWFKRTKAAFVATGILIFTALYLVAKAAGMVMTTWIFQGFFAVFLIALVVIFQEELRSVFERLAVWSLRRADHHPSLRPHGVEVLVRAVGRLARSGTGALIVLRGRDPLDRHLEGGYELGGLLSGPLLESIFDKHSDGHDGAVVLEGERVVSFAAHLPLSKDFAKLPGMGTRHAAALGLSERTDALCIVVSEERGTVSTAKAGEISECLGLADLQTRVVAHLGSTAHRPEAHRHRFIPESAHAVLRRAAGPLSEVRWSEFFERNLREKGLAAAFALGLWLGLVPGFKQVHQDFLMPVVLQHLSRGLTVRSVVPEAVRVRISGAQPEFRLLRPSDLRVYIDLSGAGPGPVRVTLSEVNVRVPPALRFTRATPSGVTVDLAQAPEARP